MESLMTSSIALPLSKAAGHMRMSSARGAAGSVLHGIVCVPRLYELVMKDTPAALNRLACFWILKDVGVSLVAGIDRIMT
jgi:hypothetical protein